MLCICFEDGSGGSFTKESELLWKEVESEWESAQRMNSVGLVGVSAPAAVMLFPSSWAASVLLLYFVSNSPEVSRNSAKGRKSDRKSEGETLCLLLPVNCDVSCWSWAAASAAAESFPESRKADHLSLNRTVSNTLWCSGGLMRTQTRMWDLQKRHRLPVSTYQFLPAAPGSDFCRPPAVIANTRLLYWPVLCSLTIRIMDDPDLFSVDGAHLAHAAAAGHRSQVQAAVAAVHPHAGLSGDWVLWLGVLGVDAGKRQTGSAGSVWTSSFP